MFMPGQGVEKEAVLTNWKIPRQQVERLKSSLVGSCICIVGLIGSYMRQNSGIVFVGVSPSLSRRSSLVSSSFLHAKSLMSGVQRLP